MTTTCKRGGLNAAALALGQRRRCEVGLHRVTANTATANGGGVYQAAPAVSLTGSAVINNTPDNCAPVGTVPGCNG
ncbi:hypothetical protein DB35_09910 [Streptomyces abyssalis]|uniref:Uncharacterized protein n=1 Tax=Streptomyces abyssalis TaxID=933944 RepID=A0A1E7JI43_9ACTN|nr:hypothetical protein [Streptomyces abyssalis]OEU86138.1 hypothetical protein AN215_27980 [Streptomyces abyssalis]OEU92396.1 hypothetical protein DB35_09910 [Streptomyces abyssalis]